MIIIASEFDIKMFPELFILKISAEFMSFRLYF